MNMRKLIASIALVTAVACSKEEAKQAKENVTEKATQVAQKVGDAIDVAVPLGERDDPAAREKERFNEEWRGLETFKGQPAQAPPPQTAAPAANVKFAPNGKESGFKGVTAEQIESLPVVVPIKGDVSGPSVLKAQVYLDRANFSVGAIDGRWGRNAAIAVWWYQRSRGINAAEPGALDQQTYQALATAAGGAPALVQRTLTEEDVKGPFVTVPQEMYDKAKLDCLCYESKKEKIAEKFHATQELLDTLNPDFDFSSAKAGDRIWVPNVRDEVTQPRPDIARVVVSIKGNTFNAFDAQGNLVFHAPTTLGNKYDPSPRETVTVKKIAHDPHFHYQPKLFHEVPDDEPEANLNPGPNSPVGVVWIALSKPHFGVHGTSDPDSIGYASSHGCVRLTNWDAKEVANRISEGVQIEFLDTRGGGQQAAAGM